MMKSQAPPGFAVSNSRSAGWGWRYQMKCDSDDDVPERWGFERRIDAYKDAWKEFNRRRARDTASASIADQAGTAPGHAKP